MSNNTSTERFEGHTAGPWKLIANCIFAGPNPDMGPKSTGRRLATIEVKDANPFDLTSPIDIEGERNAELIAAAPSLLAERDNLRRELEACREALQAALPDLEEFDETRISKYQLSSLSLARAALGKGEK